MTNELTFDEWIENANKKAEEIIERTEEKRKYWLQKVIWYNINRLYEV